jgi:hypothetical protein
MFSQLKEKAEKAQDEHEQQKLREFYELFQDVPPGKRLIKPRFNSN